MTSPFASQTKQTIPLPFDPPQTATIRTLTGRELERAEAEHVKTFIAGRPTRGWAALFMRKIAEGIATNEDAEKAVADPLNGYDRTSIVKAGLVAWSYDTPVTPDAVEDLVDEALEYLATEIMRQTRPALFQSPEVAQKETAAPALIS